MSKLLSRQGVRDLCLGLGLLCATLALMFWPQEAMEAAGLVPAAQGGPAAELLRRPEIHYPLLAGLIGWGEGITPMLAERLETEVKYAGYIARQDRMIRDVARREKTLIPEDFSYQELTGLTLEAREKLARIRPRSLGQAGRIPGVSPSDLAQLSIALAAAQKQSEKEASHDR